MRKSTLNRMLELADIKPVIKEGKNNLSNFELVKESVDGNTYVIVKESKKYYIKQSETKEGLIESDFDYVGGVANKGKNSFKSFSDATKHLNLMFDEINERYETEGTNILESDGVLSEKKFVLKMPKKSKPTPEPAPEEEFDFGGEEESTEEGGDEFDFGSDMETVGADEFDFDDEESAEEGGEEEFDFEEEGEEESTEGDEEFDFEEEGEEEVETDVEEFDTEGSGDDEVKTIQSTTGKLGQQLRDIEDISSDMKKWVAKSVLSALDLENMDSDDKEDILDTIEKSESKSEPEMEMEESYDSYMEDEEDEFDGMDKYFKEDYDSYMDDYMYEDNPNIGGDEDVETDELLFDDKMITAKDLAKKEADKDIKKHFHRPARPGYETDPSEKWAKHKLPYDTKFDIDLNENINEDHLNDEMETYEQEKAYEDVETFVRRYGMDVELCHKESNEDPEESIIYLDIVDGDKKLLKVRINSVGDIEVGEMKGKNFVGEPVDSVEDFIEIFGEDLTKKEKEDLDMMEDIEMNPQKAPKTKPNEPATKPGTPSKTPGRERPSRRPFTPPPSINPNDPDTLPGPKAGREDEEMMDSDVEFE